MTADTRDIPASSTLIGLTTNLVIKGAPAQGYPTIMRRVVCNVQNTAAAYINDGTATASGATTFWSIGSAGMTVGQVSVINWPCFAGLTFVPGGGTFSLAWD